jgi:hypothetical protein
MRRNQAIRPLALVTALLAGIGMVPSVFAQFDPEPQSTATQTNTPTQTNNYNSDAEVSVNPENDPNIGAEDQFHDNSGDITNTQSSTQNNSGEQENNPTQINSNSPSMTSTQSFSQTPSTTCSPETGTFNSEEKLIGDEACRLF